MWIGLVVALAVVAAPPQPPEEAIPRADEALAADAGSVAPKLNVRCGHPVDLTQEPPNFGVTRRHPPG
jgi:hypothetical protein